MIGSYDRKPTNAAVFVNYIIPFAKEFRSLPPFSVQPVPAHMDRGVGLFVIDGAPLPAAAIGAGQQTGYVPAWYPDGAVGVAGIGRWAIGHLRPYHGRLTVVQRSLQPGGPQYPVLMKNAT